MSSSLWLVMVLLVSVVYGTEGNTTTEDTRSFMYLEEFIGRVVRNMEREEPPVEDEVNLPDWRVKSPLEPVYCLLASAQIRLEIQRPDSSGGANWTLEEVSIPDTAQIRNGGCEDPGKSEIQLQWRQEGGEEDNLLNLVVKRQSDTLALLGGAYLRLQNQNGEEEFYASMKSGVYSTLIWPIRYQVRCPDTLSYVLRPVQDQLEDGGSSEDDLDEESQAKAILHLIDLRMEAFRESTEKDFEDAKWFRREWGCEFHRTFKWAPYFVASGMAGLVLFLGFAFLCKNSLNKKNGNYEVL